MNGRAGAKINITVSSLPDNAAASASTRLRTTARAHKQLA